MQVLQPKCFQRFLKTTNVTFPFAFNSSSKKFRNASFTQLATPSDSDHNNAISSLRLLTKCLKETDPNTFRLVEGFNNIGQLKNLGHKPLGVVVNSGINLTENQQILLSNVPVDNYSAHAMKQKWGIAAPWEAVGIFDSPTFAQPHPDSLPITLVLDQLRTPGNMASILHLAASFHVQCVLLMKGCVSLQNPKVVQSAGLVPFAVNVQSHMNWSNLSNCLDLSTCHVFAADTPSSTAPQPNREGLSQLNYLEVNFAKNVAIEHIVLIIGGETTSLSLDAMQFVQKCRGALLYIPISKTINSLNAAMAATVLLTEIQRQILLNK